MVSGVFSRVSRYGICPFRSFASSYRSQLLPALSNPSKSFFEPTKAFDEGPQLHRSFPRITRSQGFKFSSTASTQASNKEINQSADEQGVRKTNKTSENISQSEANVKHVEGSGHSEAPEQEEESSSTSGPELSTQSTKKRRRGSARRITFSDSDSEEDLSLDDLVKLVAEKDELLKVKDKEFEMMKDKALRSYAEMENVIERTKRESENSKKFAIQGFAKSLLDVADNLSRASSVGKDSLSKVDESKDPAEAARRLKELLEGVEMTLKLLTEVFRKFGVEKYDPLNEQFDPNRHHAVVQVPDASKPPGTVAAVLKVGYVLHERIIRPAEVVVVSQPEGGEKES